MADRKTINQVVSDITEAMKEVRMIKDGELPEKTARELLKEIDAPTIGID